VNHPGTGRPDPAARPAGRYGERRTSRLLVACLVVVCVTLFGWLLWAALAASTPDTRSSLVSFRVLDDRRVEVRFVVTADRARAVTCTLQALDAGGEVVGVTQVAVAPGRHDRREVRSVVGTRSLAANAAIAGCRLRADD
jgi:Domain of unknown function (DUF4307)